MAKLLVILVSCLLLLNALTFVFVVTQEPQPEPASGGPPAAERPAEPRPQPVSRPEPNLLPELRNLTSKVDRMNADLQRRLRTLEEKVASVEQLLAAPPPVLESAAGEPPASTGDRAFDFSRLPPGEAPGEGAPEETPGDSPPGDGEE